MKAVLHGGRFDGDHMDIPVGVASVVRADAPYNPGSDEVPPFAEHPKVTYRRTDRVLDDAVVFVLAQSKL